MANFKKRKGIFITFEGPDGCGKSTIVKIVKAYLEKMYKNKIQCTREPGGTNNQIAEDIRDILLNKETYSIAPNTEALLFAASRAQHVCDFIKPNLILGNIVICDRFIHSSLVYQGYMRGIGIEKVNELNKIAIDNVWPDMTFILMSDPKTNIARINSNAKREINRMDKESIDNHEKVYQGYKKLQEFLIEKKITNNIHFIDATKTIIEVSNIVIGTIDKYINKKWK